jgi:hypothetical protein
MATEEDLEKIRDRFNPGYFRSLDIGAGWHDLVVDLDRAIAIIDPGYRLAQVKEKFGGLRYYCMVGIDNRLPHDASARVHALVAMAEEKSYHLCEACGGEGQLRTRFGWMKTLCGKCAEGTDYVILPEDN